jgi:GalNAc-alpha-(1->4)-GalNAc-alpha-(1->3)-diNAcBac-PP-undecaprenol alpha-1,4-N-acetyl-D-galactosaminyltransferase
LLKNGGEKGQNSLIEAFSKIDDKTWKLQILGDGPLRKDLEELAKKLNCENRVEFLGFKKEVDFFLSKAQIFAFTSIIEGYPNALIEGMANGLAPISFDCKAGPSDIIQNDINGFLIPINDVILFAEKLNILVNNEDLRSIFQEQALKVLQTNNLQIIANQYQEFLFLE